MHHLRLTPVRAAVLTALYVLLWQAAVWGARAMQWREVSATATSFGLAGLYLLGLAWVIWSAERIGQRIESRRLQELPPLTGSHTDWTRKSRSWNPLDPAAWYYGRRSQRLRQSLVLLALYSLLFVVLVFYRPSAGGVEPYELPAGGGQDVIRQNVQIQRVVKKKFVINPYSSILFNPPPIDQVELKLLEVSQSRYQVGQGEGQGAGFGKGTSKGKVRFIRLKHSDRNWDKNFGIGGDMNLLAEYGSRLSQKIGDQTEYIEVSQLAAFPARKSPPLVYVTGSQTFLLSQGEKKTLRQYLLERHGMVFGDNTGGRNFHNQFLAALREVTGVQEVPIPRDDYIHRRPYSLPSLPIVVAHGGTVPLGWKVDGRWVAYYHPGALSDAWRDDHAGIRKEIWEDCYQLGINVLFYAHAEYNQWLLSQGP